MINGFNLTQSDWQQTPSPVRIAAISLQHQLYILNARLNVHQQQNSELKTKSDHLERIKDEQTAEIKALKLKVTELKEQMQQNSANSSLPPSSDSPFQQPESRSESSGRKPGAQAGHPGVGRRLIPADEVDRMIELRPEQCGTCGALLLGDDSHPARRQTVELVQGQSFVTEDRRHRLRCLSCCALNCARWSIEARIFGASVQAMVAYLTGRLNLSQRDAAEAMQELFHLKIGLGSISALQRRVGTRLAEPVAQALEFVQQQSSQAVDETGWREKSQSN